MLRGSVAGAAGLGLFALVGCDDDGDAEGSPDDMMTATGTAMADDDMTASPTGEAMMTETPDAMGSATGTPMSDDMDSMGAVDLGEPKQFDLVQGWYQGADVEYYDFGATTPLASPGGASVAVAPIYAFVTGIDAQGMPQSVEGQHNIVDVIPGDEGYSDLWEVSLVVVDEMYAADSIRSAADVMSSGFEMVKPGLFVNCPVVPEDSTFEGGEQLVQGWYQDQVVYYPDFGANDPVAIPIWVFSTGMDAAGMPRPVEGQRDIIDAVPGDAGYSAFWLVHLVTVPGDYEANSITSATDVAASGYEVTRTDMLVNCPVV
ncbi:MAG: hypothetical protein GEU80_00685 [Dehalococcoidia bacterium]|nr:hypothetical protein [Dehalococcoidia bacterium]